MPVVNHDRPQTELHLRGFTCLQRQALMPELGVAIDHAGGWVLQRRTLAANALELVLESQLAALPDVYGAFLGVGVELTRQSHRAITQQYLCSQYLPPRRGTASIVLIFVQIQFLDSPPEPPGPIPTFSQKSAIA